MKANLRRLLHRVRRSALTIVLLLLAVALVLTVLSLTQQSNDTARVCHLVRTNSHVLSEFIRTDAIDRRGALTTSERNQALAAIRTTTPGLLARAVRAQNALDTQTINYWRHVLIPQATAVVVASHCPPK